MFGKIFGSASGLFTAAALSRNKLLSTGFDHVENGEEEEISQKGFCEEENVLENLSLSLWEQQEMKNGRNQQQAEKLKVAENTSKALVWSKMNVSGTPGMSVAVSVDGKLLWRHGFGYSDIENRVTTSPNSVMRIASISKALTMATVAKLVEEKKLDLDKPVKLYLGDKWPEDKQNITTRQLVSHLSGIRHYLTKEQIENNKRNKERKKNNNDNSEDGGKDGKFKEFHLNKKFESVVESLEIFEHDELLHKPGEKFHYTTHGFTVLSAVVESACGESFEKRMKRTFRDLGLKNTFLDENEPILFNRARYYVRDKNHILQNAPNVDNSCKWAGGGFLSNVQDLVKFGNAMLFSYQQKKPQQNGTKSTLNNKNNPQLPTGNNLDNVDHQIKPFSKVNRLAEEERQRERKLLPGYLKKETMDMIWQPVTRMAGNPDSLNDNEYGMGWEINPKKREFAHARNDPFTACHTGGGVGASSILFVLPSEAGHNDNGSQQAPPRGVVVAILCNMQGVNLRGLAMDIAREFSDMKPTGPYRVQKVFQC